MSQSVKFEAIVRRSAQSVARGGNLPLLVFGSCILWAGSLFTASLLFGPLSVGYAATCLKMSKGEAVVVEDLWSGFAAFDKWALIGCTFFWLIFAGFLSLFVPGIVTLTLSPLFFIVLVEKQDQSAFVSMNEAIMFIRTHSYLVLLNVVSGSLMFIVLVPTIVGLILFFPFIYLLNVSLWRELSPPPEAK